jgi:hypothetical protein
VRYPSVGCQTETEEAHRQYVTAKSHRGPPPAGYRTHPPNQRINRLRTLELAVPLHLSLAAQISELAVRGEWGTSMMHDVTDPRVTQLGKKASGEPERNRGSGGTSAECLLVLVTDRLQGNGSTCGIRPFVGSLILTRKKNRYEGRSTPT